MGFRMRYGIRYGGEEVRSRIWELCRKVWRREYLEGWKERVIDPIKKGEREKVEEYREVTLTQTAYKVYASVLTERLREEVE